jgi:hypothetical protein
MKYMNKIVWNSIPDCKYVEDRMAFEGANKWKWFFYSVHG